MLDRRTLLNARFRRSPFSAALWSAGTLADAGALLHCFDGWEDHTRQWRSTGDQSASFVSSAPAFAGGVIPIFHPDGVRARATPHLT